MHVIWNLRFAGSWWQEGGAGSCCRSVSSSPTSGQSWLEPPWFQAHTAQAGWQTCTQKHSLWGSVSAYSFPYGSAFRVPFTLSFGCLLDCLLSAFASSGRLAALHQETHSLPSPLRRFVIRFVKIRENKGKKGGGGTHKNKKLCILPTKVTYLALWTVAIRVTCLALYANIA